MKCQNCGGKNFELYFRWFEVYIEQGIGAYVAEHDISEAQYADCGQELSDEEVDELFKEIDFIRND